MITLLWILAVVLVVAGLVTTLRGQVLEGIALIVLGPLAGPDGASTSTCARPSASVKPVPDGVFRNRGR